MSRDTELEEILEISREDAYERIIHLNARQKVYSGDSGLQWFSELLKLQGGISGAMLISAPAGAEELASMSLEVKETMRVDGSHRFPRTLTRVPIPSFTGIRVRLPGGSPGADDVPEVSGKVAEHARPSKAQETARHVPKPRRSAKKPPDLKQKAIPPREEKQVEPAKKALEPEAPPGPPPKPLKVIRRRRAEEPKVFETVPKTFPRAMLEGIKVTPTDKGEKPLD